MHTKFLDRVRDEVDFALSKHPPLNSLHEAFAVLLEEVDEFKAEVWKKSSERDNNHILSELVQIAAMCCRTAEDLKLLS